MHHATMPAYKLSDHDALEVLLIDLIKKMLSIIHFFQFKSRQVIINRVAKEIRKENSIEFMFNDKESFEVFDLNELSYDILAN